MHFLEPFTTRRNLTSTWLKKVRRSARAGRCQPAGRAGGSKAGPASAWALRKGEGTVSSPLAKQSDRSPGPAVPMQGSDGAAGKAPAKTPAQYLAALQRAVQAHYKPAAPAAAGA